MWEQTAAWPGRREPAAPGAHQDPELRDEFWKNVRVLGGRGGAEPVTGEGGRIADFLQLAELMCTDALHRTESCGGHFRIESETSEGEANATTTTSCYVAAWEYTAPARRRPCTKSR